MGQPFDIFLTERYRNLSFANLELISEDEKIFRKINKFFSEGCIVKATTMGVGGGVLGLLFGTFFFTMKPMDVDTSLPFREQIRLSYKGFGAEVKSTAKNFARLSFIFSLVECFIERERATHDARNPIYAGCITGAFFGRAGGVSGMIGGCSMFAAFSAAMEKLEPFG